MISAILGPAAQIIGIFFSLLYFSRQAAEDRRAIDNRVARLEDRWLKCEEQILKIMTKLEMNR